MQKNLTYMEAIEQVMVDNGYFAPLKLLYKEIWKHKDKSKITGKTPDNTMQAIVQRSPKFTRIGIGVYALTEYMDMLPKEIKPRNEKERRERKHATIQGMLLEIGNHKGSDTYTNDKKWIFQNKTLGSLSTLKLVPPFTYEKIIKQSVNYLDVIWFNKRGFPHRTFEVEHTTNFINAFVKFMELQDFATTFHCVSPEDRLKKFEKERGRVAFKPIADRISFLTYKQVENDYQNILRKNYL